VTSRRRGTTPPDRQAVPGHNSEDFCPQVQLPKSSVQGRRDPRPPKRHVPATGQFPYLPPPAKRLPRLHVVIAHERTRQKALRLHRRRPAKQGSWHGNVFGDTCIVRCEGTAARRSGIVSRAWTHVRSYMQTYIWSYECKEIWQANTPEAAGSRTIPRPLQTVSRPS